MAAKLCQLLSILILASIFPVNFPRATMADDVCPYPCYPSPTGGAGGTPSTPAATTPPAPAGSYPPPGFNPTPTGYLPYYSPPPYGNLYVPPPPDPIFPFFPYYYKKPPHGTDLSAAKGVQKSMVLISTASFLVLFLFFHF